MQRAKALQFVKAAPAPHEGSGGVYTFRANDGLPDRYQDRVSPKGWQLDSYNANPVILYNHDEFAGSLVGAPMLPIGKGRAYVEGDALFVDVEFDQGDEFAKKVEAKVAGGFLNAVSVRYLMTKYQENDLGGYDSLEQDLLEISVVTIPGNQRAVRVKSLENDVESVVRRVVAEVMKAQVEEKPAEEPPAGKVAKAEGGALVECGACDWKSTIPSCPECGGAVTAFQVETETEVETEPAENPAAAAAAPGDEKPAVEKSINLNELAKEIAARTLSILKETA
jgi:HK97 family phage prohead protease